MYSRPKAPHDGAFGHQRITTALALIVILATPSAAQQAEELFFDDFESDLAGWEISDPEAIRILETRDPSHGNVLLLSPAHDVFEQDRTAVWIDVRDPEEFRQGSILGAKNLPRSSVLPGKDVGEVRAAKDDGRLPVRDHNTRLIIFGVDGEQARAVAEALAREAFHNVTYFAGSFDALQAALN